MVSEEHMKRNYHDVIFCFLNSNSGNKQAKMSLDSGIVDTFSSKIVLHDFSTDLKVSII